jgi:TonB family protein
MAARLLTTVPPKPPKKPMMKCSNRMVTLDVIIGDDGKVSSVKVLSGFEEFQESATTAVGQWTYKPYQANGVSVPVETTVSVFYTSDGKAGPLLIPDGKGGVKVSKFLPMPPGCGPQITIKPALAQ